jgi:phage tail P2-like protein
MPKVRFDEGPRLGDTVVIPIYTTDVDGEPLNPYKVNSVTIYYLERGVASSLESHEFKDGDQTISFATATPVKTFGNESNPAWLSDDTSDAQIKKVEQDEAGNPLFGVFEAEWTPEFNREGDYFVCWTWTPIIAGTSMSRFVRFYLRSNTTITTTLPTQATVPGKYEMLLDRYLPEVYKSILSDDDMAPDIIRRLNNSVAAAFTDLEDRANQILGLTDANAINESLLPYLANFFSWKLKSNDQNLWRRQIKKAMSLYKQKGTYKGLKEALDECGIRLIKVTKYWQVVSKSTWQEAFRVESDNQDSFTLAKIPLPLDPANFSLSILPAGATAYTTLASSDVSFFVDDGVAYMDWVGAFELKKDDILRVIYKVAAVPDQSVEDYIRTLPLADNRSEITMRDLNICYPKKNWNVRLIADDDVMLPIVCPFKHPYHPWVVFGKVRTEFPYSENIYNMDEYNGSLRDSTDPCDINRDFLDDCPCCLSSKISIDVDLLQMSNDRMVEAGEVLRDFLPFHAQIHSINFNGAIDEFILPPQEEISTYIVNDMNDNILNGQMVVNRTIQPWTDNVKRNMLASSNSLVTDPAGRGFNLAHTLYYPAEAFDHYTMGIDAANNYLEILSGLNAGAYRLTNPLGNTMDFTTTPPFPFDKTQFPFRLSNVLHVGSGDVYQDDFFNFSDANVNFSRFVITTKKDSPAWWRVKVKTGPNAGTYDIWDILPDNTLVLLGWPTTTNVSGLNYDLIDENSFVHASSLSGKVIVTRRGRFETTDNLVQQYLIQLGNFVQIGSTQYKITEFLTDSKCYLEGYAAGTQVGIATVKFYKRLVDNGIGQVGIRGMKLTTATNYYNTLQVSEDLDDDQHKDNFIILIGTNYYQIASWSNVADGSGRFPIILNGTPLPEWGTAGVNNITFQIIQFLKTSPVTVTKTFPEVITHTVDRVDRRGNEVITNTVATGGSGMTAAMAAAMLNALNSGQPLDMVSQQESITFTIEYKE